MTSFAPLSSKAIYISIPLALGVLGTFWMWYRPKRKLPPINKESMIGTLMEIGGLHSPEFFLSKMRELGAIYRLNTMDTSPWIVVCQPSLAKQLLNEHHEKNYTYKLMNGLTFGIGGLFSKQTFHDNWDWARKGVAGSFSLSNLNLKLPHIHQQLEVTQSSLRQFAKEKIPFDLDYVGVDLTMNILVATMFAMDSNTFKGDFDTKRVQKLFDILIEEYCSKQVYFPWRSLFFWDTEVQNAKRARQEVFDILYDILNNYRSSHTKAEIDQDSSILGHLNRRYCCFVL